MGEVVYVDFSKKEFVEPIFGITPELASYLNTLRNMGIDEDDILDTLEAINDINVYLDSDDEIKKFAEGYFQLL